MSSLRSLGSGRSNNNNSSSSSGGSGGGSGGSDGAPNIYFIKTSTFNTFENSSSACVIIEDAGPAAAMDHDALASFFKNIASSKSICSISTTSKYAIYVEVVSLSVANTLCAYIERRGVLGSYLDVKVEKGRAVDLLQQQVRTKSSYSSSSSLSRSTAASGPVVHMSYPATPASSRDSVNERNVSEHRKRSQPSSRSVSPSSRSKRVSMGLDSSTPPSSTHSPSGQRHSYHDEQQRRGASSAQHSSLSLHLHASISTSSDRIRQFLSQFSDASSSKSLDCLIYAISANPDVIRLGKTLLSEYGDAGLTTALITGVEERAFQDRLYKQAATANVKFISVINFYSCEESTTTIWRNVGLIKDAEFYNNGNSNRREKLVECFKAQLNWMSTVNARIRMQNALWRLSNRAQSVRTRTSLPEAVEPSLTGTASRSSQLTFTVTNSPSTVVSTLHDASAITSLSQSSHQVAERESQTTHGISTDSVSSRSTTNQAIQAIKDKSPALHSVKSHTVAAATATATSISASNVQASSDSQKPKSSFTSISTSTQTPTPTPAPTSTSASKLTIDADNAQTTKFETKSHTATAATAPAKQPIITNVAPVSTVVPRMVDASVMTDIRSTDMDIEEATAVFRRCFPDHQPSLNLYLRMAQSTPGKAGPKTAQSPVTNTTANGIKPKAHSQPPLNTTAADPRTQHQPKSPVQAKANKNPQTQQAAQTNVNPHTQVPQANKAVHHPATWQQQQQQREISKTLTDASTPKVDTQTSPLSITTPTNTQNGHTATQQYQGITQPQQQQQQQQQAHTQQNGSHSHPQLQVQNQNSIQAQPQPHPIAQVYSQPVTQPQPQSQSQLQTQQIAQLQQTAQQMPMNTMFMPQQFQSQQQQYQQQNMMMQWMQFQAYMQSQQMSQQMLQQQAQQMQQAQFQQPQTQSQTQPQPQQMHTQFTQAPLVPQMSGMTMPQE